MSLTRPTHFEFVLDMWKLRSTAIQAHFFGLGFIQVKLTENARVHFYHPDIPAFVEDPHDHRYDFVSTIARGKLGTMIWRLVPGDDHEVSYADCRRTGQETPESFFSGLEHVGRFDTSAGSGYHMNSETLHTVRPDFSEGPLITLVEREVPRKDFALVVRRRAAEPVCPFSRPMPEDEMWDIVEKCVQGKV